jgi:5-hydroxyisourate hydrolase
MTRSLITTHVLDTARGRPAAAIDVQLERQSPSGQWQAIGSGTTDADGRISNLTRETLTTARYRITFATGAYFMSQGTTGFYPAVCIEFAVERADEHYHVPLLLSPYGYATYRGS